MNEEYFDSEYLIRLVESHPALWDSTCEEFRDRNKKKSIWNTLCSHFIENFSTRTLGEQDEIRERIIQKWRNIKDSYVKYLKLERQFPPNSQLRKKRPYIYSEQLAFLAKVSPELAMPFRSVDIKEEIETSSNSYYGQDDSDPGFEQCPPKRSFPENYLEILTPEVRYRHQEDADASRPEKRRNVDDNITLSGLLKCSDISNENGDLAFLVSVVPLIKNFDEDQRLEFRTEVLSLIKKIKDNK